MYIVAVLLLVSTHLKMFQIGNLRSEHKKNILKYHFVQFVICTRLAERAWYQLKPPDLVYVGGLPFQANPGWWLNQPI